MMIVAPLTATVRADANQTDAGIVSAINNAIARVSGLFGISATGAIVASNSLETPSLPTGQSDQGRVRKRRRGRQT